MKDKAFIAGMKLLPKSLLSSAVGAATELPVPKQLHQIAMRLFSKGYGVDLSEAEKPISDYSNFASFFARKLRPGSRPIDPSASSVVSPVDGRVSQAGVIAKGHCIQAKGIFFPVSELLGSEALAKAFEGGTFATLYLSPRDYHRIHSPIDGEITGCSYMPGELWPVNPASVSQVDRLFCVNERLAIHVTFEGHPACIVAVGATCVGRIKTTFSSLVTNQGGAAASESLNPPLRIKKGDEIARFEMGSTVILLFPPHSVEGLSELVAGSTVILGTAIGRLRHGQ